MRQFLVCVDAIAVADDRLVSVVCVQDDGTVVVRDLSNGALRALSAGQLRSPPSFAEAGQPPLSNIAQATDEHWELARRREGVVAAIAGNDDVGDQVDYAAAQLGVSKRTIFRWLAAYREAPQTSALLPRPRGTPLGARRIDPRLEEIVAEVIDQVYLTKVRAKKEEVVRQVQLRCANLGLQAPSRKPILARLKSLDSRLVVRRRLQSAEAASLTNPVPGSYQVRRPLEVVQIDHTLADVIVVDDAQRLAIGRPWLTLAIDVATRVVVGFYVSLEAPSATSVALCLTHAVMPKEAWLVARSVKTTWPAWGLPRAIHADNGPDFKSAALRRGCDEHGIKVIQRPVAAPHYGGHIERLIGTIMGRVHLLPGTTGSNPMDRGAYPAQAEAVLTMRELEQWLAIEICEHYHQRVHSGLGVSPSTAWKEATRPLGAAGALPADGEQFTISFLPFEERKLRRDGLYLFNIRYWDPVVPLIVTMGQTVMVRYDPRNLSKVYLATKQGRYQAVPYADLLRFP